MPAPAVAAAGLRVIPWLLRLLSKGGKAGRFVGRELPFWELVPSTPPEPVNSKNKLARALTGLPARKVASLALHP